MLHSKPWFSTSGDSDDIMFLVKDLNMRTNKNIGVKLVKQYEKTNV